MNIPVTHPVYIRIKTYNWTNRYRFATKKYIKPMLKMSQGTNILRDSIDRRNSMSFFAEIPDLWQLPDGIYQIGQIRNGSQTTCTLTPYVKPKKPEQLKLDLQ